MNAYEKIAREALAAKLAEMTLSDINIDDVASLAGKPGKLVGYERKMVRQYFECEVQKLSRSYTE